MNDKLTFLEQEKREYGKTYADITYAIDNISPFLEKEDLNKRKFVRKIEVLKRYLELVDSCKSEVSQKGFLRIFKNDNSISLLDAYKRGNNETLSLLSRCSKCSCLNCTSTCCFDSCSGCRPGSHIATCDHKRINVTLHSDFSLDLTNDRTGMPDRYRVLATLQECQADKKYIIIQSSSQQDKFILYYYPGIVEDTYGEINDPEEFDFVVSAYENL